MTEENKDYNNYNNYPENNEIINNSINTPYSKPIFSNVITYKSLCNCYPLILYSLVWDLEQDLHILV